MAARRAFEQAQAAQEQALQQAQLARTAEATARAQCDAAEREFEAVRRACADPARVAARAAAQQRLTEARAEASTAQARADELRQRLDAVRLPLLEQDVQRLRTSAEQVHGAHVQRATAMASLEAVLSHQGALGLEELQAERAQQRTRAQRRVQEFRLRAAALDHLLQRLRFHRNALAQRLRAPLQARMQHYLEIVFPGVQIEIADDLSPGRITRLGAQGPESGSFAEFSVGAREQIGIMARLAYADLLQEAGRPTLIILDDALVHTDEARLGQMKRVLFDAAQRHQVLIFTCHPQAWRDLGVVARRLEALPTA